MGLEIDELMQLPRGELEALYLTIQTNIKQNLELSDGAITFISLLMTTLNAIKFDEHIFDMSPLSVATLKQIRHQLGKD
jgi:hypothetical protein